MNDLSPQLSTEPNPAINPEVQEALSKRYSIAAIVTPLDNGKFAVFHNDRSIDSLVICYPEDLPTVVASRAKMNPRKTPLAPLSSERGQAYTADFSDL